MQKSLTRRLRVNRLGNVATLPCRRATRCQPLLAREHNPYLERRFASVMRPGLIS